MKSAAAFVGWFLSFFACAIAAALYVRLGEWLLGLVPTISITVGR